MATLKNACILKGMKFLRLGAGVAVLGLLSLVFVSKAHAATFTVNDTGDASAVDPSVSCNTAGDVCTLRSSIEAANAQAGADSIEFNISGAGVHTIAPASALPTIAEQVTIDGTTQTGASCGTLVPTNLPASNTPHALLVEVSASSIPSTNLFHFANGSSDSVLKGLVMNGISDAADVQIDSTIANMTVECNYIGTNTAGDAAAANNGTGIVAFVNNAGNVIQNNLISASQTGVTASAITVQNNLIGTNAAGTAALPNTDQGINTDGGQDVTIDHNIISGNAQGIFMGSNGLNIAITGNYIGLGVTASPLANTADGIAAFGTSNFSIGGTSNSQRNVISANGGDGIHIYRNCNSNSNSINSTTYNNYIGTNTSGTVQSGYGNGGAGIEVNEYYGGCVSVYQHKIGGDAAGQANIIAGNTNQGILIHQSGGQDVFSISVLGNSIHGNGQFGIDLAADSDSNSGTADTDLGPNPLNDFPIMYPTGGYANHYLNRPAINSTSYSGNQLTVNYTFQAPPSVTDNAPYLLASNLVGYRLDFYLNDAGQDGAYDGYSQGKTHIGSFIVDGSESNASHVFTSPAPLSNGQTITATTTVLWQVQTCPNAQDQDGNGPPYQGCSPP